MSNQSAGRAGRRWQRLKAEVKARGRAAKTPCCRCERPIDYDLVYPDPASFSVDHYPRPLATHPHLAEDPSNLAPSHLLCNQSAGKRGQVKQPATSERALGITSADW